MTRRTFAQLPLLAAAGPAKFFRVGERRGHSCFLTPRDEPFFSIGMNHIDPAVLFYPENIGRWRESYGGDRKRWIQSRVVPDLQSWGFNTIGWTQEIATRNRDGGMHHSAGFTYDDYRAAGMPFCHLLPFAESHEWDFDTPIPDFFSDAFEQWCDFVARSHCAPMANEPNLIGYFYADCPTWVHTHSPRKPPIFDPAQLQTEAGRKRLSDLASHYYNVTHDAVRRYDPNHLILGDRYEAKALLPDEILRAAKPYVDVLSFQYFADQAKVCPDLARWHDSTGMPVLLADAPVPGRNVKGAKPETYGRNYEPMIRALRETKGCVGWHLCGAYLQNRVRNYGFLDEQERPYEALASAARKANRETAAFISAMK